MEHFYRDFYLISETDIPDANGKGIYLYHKKTGLEIFHVLNDDEENLFSFTFRTPVKNSMGQAHIMEHSVLCGSEKLPLKEPFTNLCNQSMKTFLNALTYPDKTCFPASSLNETDYFNLMDVYGDAVFFPLLSENTFLQEAHRLELDENGNHTIQGVVYNEMKGAFSSFSRTVYSTIQKSLFKDSSYAFTSGGDPLEIPYFTYEQFREFHRDYYRPSNCLLFLYGNIPTEKQLDYIQEKILDRLEKKYDEPEMPEKFPRINEKFIEMQTSSPITDKSDVYAIGPDADTTDSTAAVCWKYTKEKGLNLIMETSYIFNLLFSNDSSPLRKALLDSKLGNRVYGGGNCSFETSYNFGLCDVKKEDAPKVKELVLNTLQKIYDEGIEQKDIDASVLVCDFANREITRNYGPYALTLLDRAADAWNYGRDPAEELLYRQGFEKIKQNLQKDPEYTKKLIKKYFLDNDQCILVTVTPDEKFLEERNKAEEKLIERLTQKTDGSKLNEKLNKLHEYQNHRETEEEASCIPHISPEDLEPAASKFTVSEKSLKASDGSEIPLFLNEETTNGIIYLDVCCPLDRIPLDQFKYIQAFNICALSTGWNGKSWDKALSETALCTGDFYTSPFISSSGIGKKAEEYLASIKDKNYANRYWMNFSMKMTVEKSREALKLFAEAYNYMDFNDSERIKTLLNQSLEGMKSSILQNGSWYASTRAACTKSVPDAIDEIQSGFSRLYVLNDLVKMDDEELSKNLYDVFKQIKDSGNLIHITGDRNSLEEIQKLLPEFVNETEMHSLLPKTVRTEQEYYEQTKLPGQNSIEIKEAFIIPTQVGYSACCVKFDSLPVNESASGTVLSHWLSSNLLWDKIRTTGGAYGARTNLDGLDFLFEFSTYRDPTPFKSLETFDECIDEASKTTLSDKEISRAITGSYSSQKQPQSPETHGFIGFKNAVYGILQEECDSFIKEILTVTPEALKNAAEKIKAASQTKRQAVICDEKENTEGFCTVRLPL